MAAKTNLLSARDATTRQARARPSVSFMMATVYISGSIWTGVSIGVCATDRGQGKIIILWRLSSDFPQGSACQAG